MDLRQPRQCVPAASRFRCDVNSSPFQWPAGEFPSGTFSGFPCRAPLVVQGQRLASITVASCNRAASKMHRALFLLLVLLCVVGPASAQPLLHSRAARAFHDRQSHRQHGRFQLVRIECGPTLWPLATFGRARRVGWFRLVLGRPGQADDVGQHRHYLRPLDPGVRPGAHQSVSRR